MEKEAKGVLVIKVISTNSETVRKTDNPFGALSGNVGLCDFYKNLKAIGVTGQNRWAEMDWSIFTTSGGERTSYNQACRRSRSYVIIAKVFMVTKKVVIKADANSSFSIHALLEQVFASNASELKQLAEDNPGGWKFPLFGSSVCAC